MFKMNKVCIKKTHKAITKEELSLLTKDELIDRLLSVQAHNQQLKNIIYKSTQSGLSGKKASQDVQPANKGQKPFDYKKYEFRHVLLKFYYLGWDYHGYVIQEDTTNTIEHYLFEALLKTCLIKSREESNYHRCGRTDKGVSSFSQVISIDLRSKLSKTKQHQLHQEIDYCQLLNRVLPDTIQCIAWCPVIDGYSARFECNSRSYKYFFPKGSLNIEKMNEGCKYLLGSHDFRNLCKMDVANGVTEFIRNIEIINVEPFNEGIDINSEYAMYVFTIKSKGFLWHQIRCIMGVLFLIGEEKEAPDVIQHLLNVNQNPRKPDYNLANETPLNLFNCEYESIGNWQWDQQTLAIVFKILQGQWTIFSVKSTMMKAMLSELKTLQNVTQFKQPFHNVLNQDNKMKHYVSLMERPKCDSLEVKIEHYLKRRKLERTTAETHKGSSCK